MDPQGPNNQNPYGGQPQPQQPQQPVQAQQPVQPQQPVQQQAPQQPTPQFNPYAQQQPQVYAEGYYQQPKKRNWLPILIIGGFAFILLVVLPLVFVLVGEDSTSTVGGDGPGQELVLQRQSDIAQLSSAIVQYSANNNGLLPTLDEVILEVEPGYYGRDFVDPISTERYQLVSYTPAEIYEIQYVYGGVCLESGLIEESSSNRAFAISIQSGEDTYACVDNG